MFGSGSSTMESCAHSAVSRILSLIVYDQQRVFHNDASTIFLTLCSAHAARDDK